MDLSQTGIELWQIGAGLALLLLGLIAGLALGRGDRRARLRAERLENELREARAENDAYRARVEKHFEKTSEHFRELTEQYTTLYAHLAEGARSLCPEGSQALGRGLADPLLEQGLLRAGSPIEETLPEPEPPATRRSEGDDDELTPIDEVSPLLDEVPGGPMDLRIAEGESAAGAESAETEPARREP